MKPERDHPAITPADGPGANGDPMGTPAMDEKVLWKGRPSVPVLARSAFHMVKFAIYFAVLIALAIAVGNPDGAVFLAGAGLFGLALLFVMAWQSARTTLYILTDQRLILRIGMAVEARINIPLKHITAAHLSQRPGDHGDIAVELAGERTLGYFLLWPHVRPLRFAHPQPMLRALPDAAGVAQILADACARFTEIDRHLSDVKDAADNAGNPATKGNLEGAPA